MLIGGARCRVGGKCGCLAVILDVVADFRHGALAALLSSCSGLEINDRFIMRGSETSASSVVAIAARQDMTTSGRRVVVSFAARHRAQNYLSNDLLR